MPKILHPKTVINFLNLDSNNETLCLSEEASYQWLFQRHNMLTEALHKWATVNYPNAGVLYHCSFAGLVAYFATGAYGGYGTQSLQKERYAESKTYEFYNHLHDKLSGEDLTIAIIYFVASHLLQKAPLEKETAETIQGAVEILRASKKSFKSKQVAEARKSLEKLC